jgi:hypothetical protein
VRITLEAFGANLSQLGNYFDSDPHAKLHIIQSSTNNNTEEHPSPAPVYGRGHDARSTRFAIEAIKDKENSAPFRDRLLK